MYTYVLKKYDCVKFGKFLSKKCKVSFFAKYIIYISSGERRTTFLAGYANNE